MHCPNENSIIKRYQFECSKIRELYRDKACATTTLVWGCQMLTRLLIKEFPAIYDQGFIATCRMSIYEEVVDTLPVNLLICTLRFYDVAISIASHKHIRGVQTGMTGFPRREQCLFWGTLPLHQVTSQLVQQSKGWHH